MVLVNLLSSGGGIGEQEPYIRLPAPHSHIIITPPRLQRPSPQKPQQQQEQQEQAQQIETTIQEDGIAPPADIDAMVSVMNDDRVHPFLESPPYPYARQHALDFHRKMYDETQEILGNAQQQRRRQSPSSELVKDSDSGSGSGSGSGSSTMDILYDGCPFRDIRDTSLVNPDQGQTGAGAGVADWDSLVALAPKVGDILISRYPFYELPWGSQERKEAQEYNASLTVGHAELIWGLGFWLSPTHHRQGIMSAVLKALITEWCVPMMDMRTLKSSAFVGNAGSIGTVQKCGFVKEYTLEKASADMPTYKYGGGGRQDIVVMKWVKVRT